MNGFLIFYCTFELLPFWRKDRQKTTIEGGGGGWMYEEESGQKSWTEEMIRKGNFVDMVVEKFNDVSSVHF